MTDFRRLAVLATTAAAAVLAVSGADAKTVTQPCRKNLRTGEVVYRPNFSENYIILGVRFRQTGRGDGQFAPGVCTISLRWQPAD